MKKAQENWPALNNKLPIIYYNLIKVLFVLRVAFILSLYYIESGMI